jgi:putative transposase
MELVEIRGRPRRATPGFRCRSIRATRWEHAIRNDADFERHVDYIHYNPVKPALLTRVADWPHSSFHRYVARGLLPQDWGGDLMELSGSFGE